MYSLKIKVTKEIIERSMYCSDKGTSQFYIANNCAFALAVKEIFPKAAVTSLSMWPNGMCEHPEIKLPVDAVNWIKNFDSLENEPKLRLAMVQIECIIDIPDIVIAGIGLDHVYKILENSKHLELIE